MENLDMFNAATKQQTFHDFLDRMKHPSAADLVRSIKRFALTPSNKKLDIMGSAESFIVNFLSSPIDPEKDSTSVQEFFSTTEIAFKAHPLWANATEEELESAGEGLEKYVMTKLFTRAFSPLPSDAVKDQELSDKMSLLHQFIKPEHLDLAPSFQNEGSWLLAQKELQKINTYKAPRDKLVCILNCCRVINNLLLNVSMGKNDNPPGADDFLPALIYVVIQANPPQLHSNLQYIQRYRNSSRLVSEAAYFYTNLVSAESFIDNLNAKSLSMDEAEYEEKMQAAQVNAAALFSLVRPTTPDKSSLPKENVSPAKTEAESRKSPPQNARVIDGSTTSTSTEKALSVAKLEAGGASGVVEADRSGELAKDYPFLYASAGDLRVEDVESLLSLYKELVLKYVALCKGLESIGRKPADFGGPASDQGQHDLLKPAPDHSDGAREIQLFDGLHVSSGSQDGTGEEPVTDLGGGWDVHSNKPSESIQPHEEEQWEKVTQVVSSEANDSGDSSEPVVVSS